MPNSKSLSGGRVPDLLLPDNACISQSLAPPRTLDLDGATRVAVTTEDSLEALPLPPTRRTASVVPQCRSGRRHALAKRSLDLALVLLLLAIFTPLFLVVAVLIRLESRGPVFFRQRRLGQGMQPFDMLKFRTMRSDSSPELHQRYIAMLASQGEAGDGDGLKKLTGDPRVTGLGRVLRKVSIDELPQLLNVIRGQMALVGPRPALEYEIPHYAPHHFERFSALPGMTGLWQVSGRNKLGFKEMLDLDVEYARNDGLVTDLRILAQTPRATFGRTA
jgi:lipopolysaccharide/colanic/teichoic acid biosynthesis glycosyltransferase